MLQQTAAAVAALPVAASALVDSAAAQSSALEAQQQEHGDSRMSEIERNKRVVRAHYEAMQRQAVPTTLPGVSDPPLISYGGTSAFITNYDPPGGIPDPKAIGAFIAGWHAQSTAPSIISYGPMIAEGDAVVEEWESFFHGLDGTMYSNHYCWIKQIQDGRIVQTREYLDSHHAFIVLGLHAPWKALEPPRAPRRHWRPGQSTLNMPPLNEIETVYPIR